MPDQVERQKLQGAWWKLTTREEFPGTVTLPMLTGSMAPAIPAGSDLDIASVRGRSCGIGDVVVFLRGNRLVAHRLLLCLGSGPRALCYEKGDLNAGGGWVRHEDILGVVVGRTPPQGADPPPLAPPGIVFWSLRQGLRARLRQVLKRDAADPAAQEGADDG